MRDLRVWYDPAGRTGERKRERNALTPYDKVLLAYKLGNCVKRLGDIVRV